MGGKGWWGARLSKFILPKKFFVGGGGEGGQGLGRGLCLNCFY